MQIHRAYTTADGQSHFADHEFAIEGVARRSANIPVTGAFFRLSTGGVVLDWHPAPQRQLVIPLRGTVEVEVSDGSVRRTGPGSVTLVEDLTGRGHMTRYTGSGEGLTLFLPVPDGWHL